MWLDELHALSLEERQVFDATQSFIEERLHRREILDWALKLGENQHTERLAVRSMFAHPMNKEVKEPWLSAWRWLIEKWVRAAPRDRQGLGKYWIADRIRRGERSNTLLKEIVELVRPWVEVEARGQWEDAENSGRVRKLGDLVVLRLTSGDLIRPSELGLEGVSDIDFLCDLADKLDAVVCDGLRLGRRLGWDDKRGLWRLGDLRRAYLVDPAEMEEEGNEPDQFHRGIAPSVKLLSAIVPLIAAQRLEAARGLVERWLSRNTPVHVRMWAVAARSADLVPTRKVYSFLAATTQRQFWNQNIYPEIAELRAIRFGGFTATQKARIIKRLLQQPPASHWPSTLAAKQLNGVRVFWTLRELRRIELGGGALPQNATQWMAALLGSHPEISKMSRVTEGFDGGPWSGLLPSSPDFSYDELSDDSLLLSLNKALSSGQFAHSNESAYDWLRLEGKAERVVAALRATSDHGAAYTHVWEALGWAMPSGTHLAPASAAQTLDKQVLGGQVLRMLLSLPNSTTASAIDGITHWLSDWDSLIAPSSAALEVISRLWPVAAEVTNRRHGEGNAGGGVAKPPDRDPYEQMSVDVVASPAGQLARLFGSLCPTVRSGDRPFEEDRELAVLRDQMASTEGYAGLLACYVFVRNLAWHLAADPRWAQTNLVARLLTKEASSLPYWHSVSTQSTIYRPFMVVLGERQAEVSSDQRLSADVRAALARNLTYSTLFDYWESRPLAVAEPVIQQMLRSVDDFVRSEVADVPERFLKERVGEQKDEPSGAPDPALLFFRTIEPFFRKIWPLELSLATPGVARALASLPAACGSAAADAYAVIERFIVPFETWTLMDFGIVRMEGGGERIIGISDADQASAILSLVDRAIGYAEDARVPRDLHYLLDHVRNIAPALERSRTFERLQTLTRR